MKYETELMAELEKLKADMFFLMDKPMDSAEVKEWTSRVLVISSLLNVKKH